MDSEFDYTQNIVVRSDLKISKGKLCVQIAHAAVSASETARNTHREWWSNWFREGQRKVALKAADLEDLGRLKAEADKLSLPVALIEDRGLTEVPPGTVTCLGIGPAPTRLVNKVTSKLQLL
jgi:peptidyl-tRNA hydrolase, PTH2 family